MIHTIKYATFWLNPMGTGWMIGSISMETKMNGDFKLTAAPFTPFQSNGEINVDLIPSMANHLKRTGVGAAFVNGTTGEYSSLTMDERCLLTEAWMDAGREHELDIMVHVGANNLQD